MLSAPAPSRVAASKARSNSLGARISRDWSWTPKSRAAASITWISRAAYRSAGIPEDCHPGDPGNRLSEQLEAFPALFGSEDSQPGEISSRLGQARDQSGLYRVGHGPEHDGDPGGGALGYPCRWCPQGQNDIHVELDQLGCQLVEPLTAPLPVPIALLKGNILALRVAVVAQVLLEGLKVRGGSGLGLEPEDSYPVYFCRRLRGGCERGYEDAESEDDDQSDSAAPHRLFLPGDMANIVVHGPLLRA